MWWPKRVTRGHAGKPAEAMENPLLLRMLNPLAAVPATEMQTSTVLARRAKTAAVTNFTADIQKFKAYSRNPFGSIALAVY